MPAFLLFITRWIESVWQKINAGRRQMLQTNKFHLMGKLSLEYIM